MRMIWRTTMFSIFLLLMSLGMGIFAQDVTPTPPSTPTPSATVEATTATEAEPTAEAEIPLSEVVVSVDGTLAVYYPEGWGGETISEAADIALANDPEIVAQVGSAVPESGQIMMQINAIDRSQLTPVGGLFDLALILEQMTSSFAAEDGTTPFDNFDTAVINGGPALTTSAQVDLFDTTVDAYLVLIDRQAENRVLLFLSLTGQGELDESIDLIDRIVRRTELRFSKVVFSQPITTVDGILTVQTPDDWYARSVIGGGIVLSPTLEGVGIENLERIESGQVVIQVSGGSREAVLADHSANVRDLAGWTLLNYRQPIDQVTTFEISGHPAAQIQFLYGEGDNQLELLYLFIDYEEQDSVVWFSMVTPPGEVEQYSLIVDMLVNSLQIQNINP